MVKLGNRQRWMLKFGGIDSAGCYGGP